MTRCSAPNSWRSHRIIRCGRPRLQKNQRDRDFVNKYGLGNTPVVCPEGQDPKTFVITDTAYDGDGRMINSRFLDGMTIEAAKKEDAKRLENELRGNSPVAERQGNFRLRDWGISPPPS